MKLKKFYTVDPGQVKQLYIYNQKGAISDFRSNLTLYLGHCKYFIDDLINKKLELLCYYYDENYHIIAKDSVSVYEIKKAALLL